MQQHDFTLYRGDTYALDIELTESNGAPFVLAGAKVEMLVVGDNGEEVRPQMDVNGHRITALFTAASTHDARWARGRYDLQLTFGDTVLTVLRGNIRLIEDVPP